MWWVSSLFCSSRFTLLRYFSCTSALLAGSFPSFIRGGKLWKFPLFLEINRWQLYIHPAMSSCVAAAKGSGWSWLLRVKGACWIFKRRAPLWWCIWLLLLLSPMDTKWVLQIWLFWPDISVPFSCFRLPWEQLGIACAGMFVPTVVYYRKCLLIIKGKSPWLVWVWWENIGPNTTERTVFEVKNRNWDEWNI